MHVYVYATHACMYVCIYECAHVANEATAANNCVVIERKQSLHRCGYDLTELPETRRYFARGRITSIIDPKHGGFEFFQG